MRLLLAITSEEKNRLGHRARHEFDQTGGTIGRNASCSWVLPDPTNVLSARHASISYNGRGFEITDTSTNGVYVNMVNTPIGRGNAAFLSHGDTLYLGTFVFSVTILEDAAEERRRLGVGQMAVTMRTDPNAPESAPPVGPFAPAATMHPGRPDLLRGPLSRAPDAFPPPPAADLRIRTEDAPVDGFDDVSPVAAPLLNSRSSAAPMPSPVSQLKPAASAATIPLSVVTRASSSAPSSAPSRQMIPQDIFPDILGAPDQKIGSTSTRPSGAPSLAPAPSGVAANSAAPSSLTAPSALGRHSPSGAKTSIIPDTIDFGDLLSAPLSNPERAPSTNAATGVPFQPTLAVPLSGAGDLESSAPPGSAQRQPTPPMEAPVNESERTGGATSLSAALRADMVSLRPPRAGEESMGARALDPVAMLRQRAAAGQGSSLPKPGDHSAAPFAPVAPNATDVPPTPRARQTAASTPPSDRTMPPSTERASDVAGLDPARGSTDAFWNGLGLDPAHVPPELQADLLAECGRALREAVTGLVPVLTARRSLKDELRMDQTRLKPKENNPLKFLPSGEAVLEALIDRKLIGFLPLSQAVREGFGDIKAHEVAALVALDAVIKNLLARFDPASMETPGASGRLFARGPDKTKLWDNFVRVHSTLSSNLEETTRKVMGEEFARAYAQQVESARRGGN